jgi:Holliday junction resolvase RusA-like endonuclease
MERWVSGVSMIEIPGFAVHGAPRTKKTHNRVVQIPNKGARRCYACGHMPSFPRVLPSEAYEAWEAAALREMLLVKGLLRQHGVELPILGAVSVEAHIYLEPAADGKLRRDCGDLCGFLQAVGDMLEKAEVIRNDRQIEDWDGSRRHPDAVNPRVAIFISTLEEIPRQEKLCL